MWRVTRPTPLSDLTLLSAESQGWRTFALHHATSHLQHPTWLDALTSAYRLRARIAALTNPQG
jgi:hypothetical protein